ncbi:type II secretion system protein GspD [Flavobacterium sp. RNTU_13]|uniref:type II secretion system protein GspD n=1 Tax=Flavobacterium sp. RNTU_13 TaxID=3375145 RepID=UPI0039871485
MLKKVLFILFIGLFCLPVLSQESDISAKLDEIAFQKPGINQIVKIDVSGITLHDLINSIASEHELNVSVDGSLTDVVSSNFFDVTVKSVFLFLIDKYNLDVTYKNNILIFKRKEAVVKEPEKKLPKPIDVKYAAENDFLSIKFQNDTLVNAVRAITDISGKNIIVAQDIKSQLVTAYVVNRPFDQVVEMLAKSNNLVATKDENGIYFLEKDAEATAVREKVVAGAGGGGSRKRGKVGEEGFFEVSADKSGLLSVKANMADAALLIMEAAQKLNVPYFFYNKPDNEKTTLYAEGVTMDELLDHILKGRKYTYKKQNNLYIIGDQSTEGLRYTETIALQNRSIESVLASLPKIFSEKVEIKEFVELNSLIVSGARNIINEMKDYIHQIDKVVPLVQIDVLIVQYNKSYDIQTGLKAGLNKTTPTTTGGTVFPSGDVTLNGSSVNSLIDAFNGFGIVKLGKVTQAFYLNLKFLEDNSVIKIESTPKIATLSGHEAKLSIGETNYYFEQNNQLLTNSLTNSVLQSGSWKSTDADMSVNIKPYVSADENVTLTITVEKSSFLARVGETAPPGKATQKFQSLVRVKNNEMVLLGGLDELKRENSGSGVPLLSRIPIIKWFFSSRRKSKSTAKLHIFIKPTIIY